MMIKRRPLALLSGILSAALLGGATAGTVTYRHFRTGKPVPYAGDYAPGQTVQIPAALTPRPMELRGVWLSTQNNLDFPMHGNATEFRRTIAQRFGELRRNGFNTVFFQVRPAADAFYASALNPYSQYLAGASGVGIAGIDPLVELIAEARKQKLKFHAWFNPYRVAGYTRLRKAPYLARLDAKSFARQHPELVLEIPRRAGGYTLILNPGEPAVVRHIIASVVEVAKKYPVDGIVFDDYFYPYDPIGNADLATYRRYNPQQLSLADWRRNNVDQVIAGVRRELDRINRTKRPQIEFGISPFGIWANRKSHPAGSLTGGGETYLQHYADVRKWIRLNWIDYVIPQLYWPFGHRRAAYAGLTDWWAEQIRGTRVRLYTGHTVQEFGKSGWENPNELLDQLRYDRKHLRIQGSAFFSYRGLFTPSNWTMKEAARRLTEYFRSHPAVAPEPLPPPLQ